MVSEMTRGNLEDFESNLEAVGSNLEVFVKNLLGERLQASHAKCKGMSGVHVAKHVQECRHPSELSGVLMV